MTDTIMSLLKSAWPADETAGTKKQFTDMTDMIEETLDDLHEGAWWTGLRISTGDLERCEFNVTLFDCDGNLSSLVMTAGEAQPFQWVIPACVAKGRKMGFRVSPILTSNGNSNGNSNQNSNGNSNQNSRPIVIVSFFKEMPPLPPNTAIHFIYDNYNVAFSHIRGSLEKSDHTLIVPTTYRLVKE
jgi:hypothetical protein